MAYKAPMQRRRALKSHAVRHLAIAPVQQDSCFGVWRTCSADAAPWLRAHAQSSAAVRV